MFVWPQVCSSMHHKQEPTSSSAAAERPRDALVTGQLADTPTRGLPTRGLDISRTGQLAD